MEIPDADRRLLQEMSEPLRALLDAELAAGNEIVRIGHSHPAPPIGTYFLLQRCVSARELKSDGAVIFVPRNSSLYAGEFTDAEKRFFILNPPGPSPIEPDMDAIRAAHAPRLIPDPPAWVNEPIRVEFDHRGESLTYIEPNRKTDAICEFTRGGLIICTRTLSAWWYPAERRLEPMSAAEKEATLQRIADLCRRHHGITKLTFEE